MARMVLFAQLVAAVLVVVSTASAVQAAASNSRRSTSFDHHGAELELNERGELVGEPLYNERGEMAENPRIRLVKRRAGADNSTHVAKRQSSNFNYGSTKVRGVNIGGWLVTEPWITPSLYDNSGDGRIVDEFTFVSNADDRVRPRRLAALPRHHLWPWCLPLAHSPCLLARRVYFPSP